MRKIKSFFGVMLVLVFVIFIHELNAQAPDKMSYQAVVRDASNNLVSSSNVSLRISIIQGTPDGAAVFTEEHSVQTNANGLVSFEIGMGSNQQGSILSINWGNGPYFIKTETDPLGGVNYTMIGTTQLLSVPYALYSNRIPVSVSSTGDTLMIGGQTIIVPGISVANNNGGGSTGVYPNGTIHCLPTPTLIVDVISPATGKTWMDRNLGAAQVASNLADANAYGDLYQWGRAADGHQCRNSPATSVQSSLDQPGHGDFIFGTTDWRNPQNSNLWQGVNGVNNPCPIGYRLPTIVEFFDERATWSSFDANGAYLSPLKLTVAGGRNWSVAGLFDAGVKGYYATSSVSGELGSSLHTDWQATRLDYYRGGGFSVRCIKD
jgi:hypothetical protein